MKKSIMIVVSMLIILGGLFLTRPKAPAAAKDPKILEFDTMVGLPPAFTGAQNPIRGINGGGLPWTLTSA